MNNSSLSSINIVSSNSTLTSMINFSNQLNSVVNTMNRTDIGKAITTVVDDIIDGVSVLGSNISNAFKNLHPANIYNNVKNSVIAGYTNLKNGVKSILGVPVSNAQASASGNGGGSSIGNMLAPLGGVATMAVDLLKKGAIAAISGSIQKEQDVLGLSNVLGKGKDANAVYKGIRSDAEASPFDTSTLLEANKSLLSVGSGAQQARQDVMSLANAVSATGGGKDQLLKLSEQMKEIKSSGKASGDQLKEFEATGVDVFGMLSATTGKSVAELQKRGVDYATLSKSFEQAKGQGGMYEDALGKQNNTVTGKWDMIKEKGSNALTDIGDAFMPVISKVLDIGVQFANSFAPAVQLVQPYIDVIANGLGTAVEFITGLGEGTNTWTGYVDILQGFFSTVWETLGSVFDAVWSIISGLVTWIANSELIKDVFAAVYGILGIILKAVGWIADALKWVWNNILSPILNGIESAYRWVKELITGKEVKVTKTTEIKANADLLNGMKDQDAKVKGLMTLKDPAKTSLSIPPKPTINRADETRRSNAAKSQETGDTVSGGGQKTINITLGKFFDTIQFNTLNSGETSDQLESIVMECLGRVLYNGAKVM